MEWAIIIGMAIAILLLALRNSDLQSNINAKVEKEFDHWRAREIQRIETEKTAMANQQAEFNFRQWKAQSEGDIRRDAIDRSKAVIIGKITEHFIPHLPEFRYNPKDARFLGSPIDFVVFDGMDEGDIENIVFVEIKTAASTLTTRERQIRNAVESGRVRWQEIRKI